MSNISKQNFILQCRSTASLFARVLSELRTQSATWTDRGYMEGGTDPITDAELEGNIQTEDIEAAEAAAWINMAIQLAGTVGGAVGWIGTGAPTSEKVVNVMRNAI